jgi:hypothetical protein
MREHWHSKGGGTANVQQQQQQQQRGRLHLCPRILVPETSSSLPLLKQLRMHVLAVNKSVADVKLPHNNNNRPSKNLKTDSEDHAGLCPPHKRVNSQIPACWLSKPVANANDSSVKISEVNLLLAGQCSSG